MDHDEYFKKWLHATMTPMEKNHYIDNWSMPYYRQAPGANASVILHDTPKEMKWHASHPSESTYATTLGDAVHIAVLEPDRFDLVDGVLEYFQYSPTKTLDSDKAKRALEANPDKPLVTEDLISKAKFMRDAIYANQLADKILSAKAQRELSGFAWDEDAQCMRKIRLDFRPDEGNYLADIKTTESLNELKFWQSSMKFKYHAKGAFYLDTDAIISNTIPRELFYLVAVSGPKASTKKATDGVYDAHVFEINSPVPELSLVEDGRAFYMDRLAKFANAARTNCWEGYEFQHEPTVLNKFRPRWKYQPAGNNDDDDNDDGDADTRDDA